MFLDMDCGRRRNRVDLIFIVNGSDFKCWDGRFKVIEM